MMGEYDAGYEHYIDGLHREIEKLQEQLESVVGRSFRTADKMERLEAENAKLRELVRDMWNEGMCECGSRGKCESCMYDYPTRMRELGVEV